MAVLSFIFSLVQQIFSLLLSYHVETIL